MEKWELYRVLGHPFRLAVLEALAKEDLTAGALADVGDASPSAASNALRLLEEAGLVESRREGRRVVYALRHPELARYLKRGDAITALASATARGRRRRVPRGRRA